MKLRFWEKKPVLKAASPWEIAAVPLTLLCDRKSPFSSWRPDACQLAPDVEEWVKPIVWIYQIHTYLEMLARKFGSEISSIVQEHMRIALNRAAPDLATHMVAVLGTLRWLKSSAGNNLYATKVGEVNLPQEFGIALVMLLTAKESPYFVSSELNAITLSKVPEEIYAAALTFTVAECLEHGRRQAIATFANFVENVRFNPESIAGLNEVRETEPQLGWSVLPGFYERQLLRKHKNVLFSLEKRHVSAQDLATARQLDANEAETFRQEWLHFMEKVLGAPDSISISETTQRLHELNELLQKGASIGGTVAEHVARIHETYQNMVTSLYEALKDNPEGTEALKTAESLRWSANKQALNPFISQVGRMDPLDVIPTLLSEELETICLTVEMLANTEALEGIRADVLRLMNESPEARELLLRHPEKLEVLGIASKV